MTVGARTRRTLATLALPLAASLPAAAGAQTFTFEGLGPTYTFVGSAYAPFVFQGTAQVVQDGGGYGVLHCATSGTYCLYNGNGDQNVNLVRSDAGTFTIGGGDFTSWFGSSSATVTGLLGGSTVFSQTFALTGTATHQDFGGATVDAVQFRSNGYFLADDIAVGGASAVVTPEPATLALLGAGLLAVGAVARRRRS